MAHQFDAGRRQAFSLLLDRVVDRKQFGQLERSPHGGDPSAAGRCPRHVVQQVVQQVDRRIFAITRLAEFVQRLDLPVGLPEQPLQGSAAFEPVGPDRFENGAGDPPQLEHRLRRRDLFQFFGHFRQNFQILYRAFATDVPQEADLESGTQASCPLRHGDRLLSLSRRLRHRRLIGFQVEQQQRALGQQRAAAHGP